MRIATRTVYDFQKSQLGGLFQNMAEANNVVSTRRRINKLSDDPIGLTQVLNFKSGYNYLQQLNTNIENGRTWLTSAETSLESVKDKTLSMKTLALKMKNDSVNADQRKDAVNQVNAALAELINLANTQVRGEYIFSGNRTNIQPFVFDNPNDPRTISYYGDLSAYQIKISEVDTVGVGQVGKDAFWEEEIVVDSSNNKIDFREDVRGGYKIGNIHAGEIINSDAVNIEVKNYEALDTATLDLKDLHFTWNEEDKVWNVENDPGYDLPETIDGSANSFDIDFDKDGSADVEVRLTEPAANEDYVEFSLVPNDRVLTADIPDGTYTRKELASAMENALTKASEEEGYKIEYNVNYNDVTKKYSITYDEASHDGYIKTDFLWKSGENAGHSIGPDLGFDDIDATFEPAISDHRLGRIITAGVNDSFDFSVDGGANTFTVTVPAGKYSNEDLAAEIESQMENFVGDDLFTKNFEVRFNNDDVRFEFDASETTLGAGDFEIYWNSGASGSGLGNTMGFNTTIDDTGSLEHKGRSFAPKTRIESGVNDTIDFVLDGNNYSITIPEGEYKNSDLATAIATEMDLTAGVSGFDVSFDINSGSYSIDATPTGAGAFSVLWNSGANASQSAGEVLGFDTTADSAAALSYTSSNNLPLGITIEAGVNDRINFRELPQNGEFSPELSFTIDPGTYTGDELAAFMEFEMEQQSSAEGYNIDYTVSYDPMTHQFDFRENGSELDEIQFLWNSGADRPVSEGGTGRSAAVTLGFDETEDHSAILTNTSDEGASWGIFDTLMDFKKYLENNDVEGINRTLTRLDAHYDYQISQVTEIGMKATRLDTKEAVIQNVSYRFDENRAKLEEADMVEAVSNLISAEFTYQAALSSSARIMRLSLADYLK